MGHDAFGVLFAGDIGGFASMYSITSRTLPAVGAASLSRPRPAQGGSGAADGGGWDGGEMSDGASVKDDAA